MAEPRKTQKPAPTPLERVALSASLTQVETIVFSNSAESTLIDSGAMSLTVASLRLPSSQ